jgi:hypothetical protein
VIPLAILGAAASLGWALYRAARKWGVPFLCFLAAGVSLLGASGVLAEYLWGPQWSWNFAHHGRAYAGAALVQGIFWLLLGLYSASLHPAAKISQK